MRGLLTIAALACGVLAACAAEAGDTIVAEGVIDAPVASVWRAWTTSDGLQAWLAPHAEVDLRLGGLMRVNSDPKATLDDAGSIDNRILSFEPERMLSIQVSKAPAAFPFRQRVSTMWTVLYFEPAAGDRTTLRIVGLGFAGDSEAQQMKAFFEKGNAFTLNQLQRRFQR